MCYHVIKGLLLSNTDSFTYKKKNKPTLQALSPNILGLFLFPFYLWPEHGHDCYLSKKKYTKSTPNVSNLKLAAQNHPTKSLSQALHLNKLFLKLILESGPSLLKGNCKAPKSKIKRAYSILENISTKFPLRNCCV